MKTLDSIRKLIMAISDTFAGNIRALLVVALFAKASAYPNQWYESAKNVQSLCHIPPNFDGSIMGSTVSFEDPNSLCSIGNVPDVYWEGAEFTLTFTSNAQAHLMVGITGLEKDGTFEVVDNEGFTACGLNGRKGGFWIGQGTFSVKLVTPVLSQSNLELGIACSTGVSSAVYAHTKTLKFQNPSDVNLRTRVLLNQSFLEQPPSNLPACDTVYSTDRCPGQASVFNKVKDGNSLDVGEYQDMCKCIRSLPKSDEENCLLGHLDIPPKADLGFVQTEKFCDELFKIEVTELFFSKLRETQDLPTKQCDIQSLIPYFLGICAEQVSLFIGIATDPSKFNIAKDVKPLCECVTKLPPVDELPENCYLAELSGLKINIHTALDFCEEEKGFRIELAEVITTTTSSISTLTSTTVSTQTTSSITVTSTSVSKLSDVEVVVVVVGSQGGDSNDSTPTIIAVVVVVVVLLIAVVAVIFYVRRSNSPALLGEVQQRADPARHQPGVNPAYETRPSVEAHPDLMRVGEETGGPLDSQV
eukprot:m.37131 g.37131  ORF g.37131 m.37131 type:complete len:530 (-) comp9253_c0_seq2:127-1716(-)